MADIRSLDVAGIGTAAVGFADGFLLVLVHGGRGLDRT